MPLRPVSLEDKFDLAKDRVFVTGYQALIRACLMQKERDRHEYSQRIEIHNRSNNEQKEIVGILKRTYLGMSLSFVIIYRNIFHRMIVA